MKEAYQLKTNLIYNIFYQILSIFAPLVVAPYVSRVLGVSGLGEYSYTYSVAHYFVLIMMLGVLNYGNREIAKNKDDKIALAKTFWNIYTLQFISGITVVFAYILYILYFCREYQLVSIIQGMLVVSGIFDVSWFYFGLEMFRLTTIFSIFTKLFSTMLIFLLVKNNDQAYVYSCIISGGILLNNIICWSFLKKYLVWCKPTFNECKEHIKPLFVLFIPVIAISLYKYMDKIMLGAILNISEVGLYESAEKFINLPMCVIAAIGTVMLPRITNMEANHECISVRRYNFISMILVMFLSLGMSFGLFGIAEVFIPWFYGTEFNKATDILIILLPSIVFVSWANVIRTQCLLPNKRDKEYCISVILGAIINLITNLLLIPMMGAFGAAIGTLVAESAVCIIQSLMCRKNMDFLKYFKFCIPLLTCALIMTIIMRQINFHSPTMTIILRIIIGGAIYALLSNVFIKNAIKEYQNWGNSNEI